VNYLVQKHPSYKQVSQRLLMFVLIALLAGCDRPANFEEMIPTSFETAKSHLKAVRVTVTGGQETQAVGRPLITNGAFAQALIESITKSRTFAKVIDSESQVEDYLLTVTLFSMDKRLFGRSVKLEAGWTLRRASSGTVVWKESIVSENAESDVKVATEGAARSNIAKGLAKMAKLDL